jgi:hypothetical protein
MNLAKQTAATTEQKQKEKKQIKEAIAEIAGRVGVEW